MRRSQRLLLVLALSFPLSQLGHALASALRGAGPVPGGAAHLYFGPDLAVSVALLAAAGAAATAVLVAARVQRGERLRIARRSVWPLAWTLVALAALQLEIFLVQELVEGATTIDVAWRGLLGQLPVAAAAALAVHLLSGRLGPARRQLRQRPQLLAVDLAAPPLPKPRWLTSRTRPAPASPRLGRAPPPILQPAV